MSNQRRNEMTRKIQKTTLPMFGTILLAGSLHGAPQSAEEMEESAIRKAFMSYDISLEAAVRDSRRNARVQEIRISTAFSTEQAAPGRAARARELGTYPLAGSNGLFEPLPLKTWKEHDQITIVVLEAARVERSQELDTEKDWALALEVAAWTDFFNAGNLFTANGGSNLPRFEFVGEKDFDGKGDYGSAEEITFRTTATVLEVLPNGNLVLQARHTTKTDAETTVKTITGTVDPRHVAADDTILHWRLYDLDLNIQNSGFVNDAATVGIVAQIIDAIFAF